MKLSFKKILFIIIFFISAGIVLFTSNLFYDYYSNYYMKEDLFTPNPILSNKIKVLTFNYSVMFSNKITNTNLLASNIQKAFYDVTGKLINNEPEYTSLILAIMIYETGFRYNKKILPWIPIPETWIHSKTNGIMQVAENQTLSFYENLVFAIRKLDKIVRIYAHNNCIDDNNVKFIFADWCAGAYSCKIASLQSFLNKKLSLAPPLEVDGILGKITANALFCFDDYNKTDAESIIKDGITKVELKDSLGIEKSRYFYINSSYYKNLQQKYPELQVPVISKTGVIDVSYKIRNKLSFSAGWSNSKEYAEKAFQIYKEINNIKI